MHESLADALIPGGPLPNGVVAPAGSTTPVPARLTALLAMPDMAALAAELEGLGDIAGVERRHPKAFARLVTEALAAYYEAPQVLAAFGWPATPPHPAGYPLEPFDPALLDPVRRREAFWRR